MKSTASLQNGVSEKVLETKAQFQTQLNEYLHQQHPIVRSLHQVLKGLAVFCTVLGGIFLVAALYQTYIWATTGSFTSLGAATYLPNAWVNFGLSMSFVAFPLGLDSMLMRVFPAIIYPATNDRSGKWINYKTGLGAFFAGFGIMCAGAPGAVHMVNLALAALQKLF